MRGDRDVRGDFLEYSDDAKFLTHLILSTFVMLLISPIYLRALASSLLLFLLLRIKGASYNLGTLKGLAFSSLLAFIMTLPFLFFVKIGFSGVNPMEIAQMIPWHISVALWEECLYRGPILGYSLLRFILSSLLFSILHSQNPGFGVLPFIGIFSSGIFLCLLRIRWGLLSSISFHLSWNICLEHLWGFPTSGLIGPSFLTVEPIELELLTGGTFGPEGSIVAVAEFILLSLMLGSKGVSCFIRKLYKLETVPPLGCEPDGS